MEDLGRARVTFGDKVHDNPWYLFAPGSRPPSEKAMAPHSSTLAWKVPWTEKPGGLQSMGSRGVGHD